jgi:surface polysaccharide O-acyltransferase-like enzyme
MSGAAAREGNGSDRIVWIDLIRVASLYSVVVLHIAAVAASAFGSIPMNWWWGANLIDAAVRPCVPLFVMVSGALLLYPGREQPFRVFLRRRVSKVVIPLLAWSVLYAIWRIAFHGQSITLLQFFRQLVTGMGGAVSLHLWFLYLIVSLYLITPILRVYVRHASTSNQLYFAALWLLASAVRPLLEARLGLVVGLSLEPVTGFVGYFVLGSTLRKLPRRPLSRGWIWTCTGVYLTGYAVAAAGTYLLTRRAGALDESFYGYLSLNVIAMSIAGFVLLGELGRRLDEAPRTARWRSALATCSVLGLGAYLVHAMVIEALQAGWLGWELGPLTFYPLIGIPVVAALAFGISLGITALLRRIPGLRIIVP